jgi:2-polyprenyl-3-methyl-5-hydroxy-6-metoxy-1,4-benzoquinol methylase
MSSSEKPSGKPMEFTSSDVLLANQLYYKVQAGEYDDKNHVRSRAIQRYYTELFERHVFAGTAEQAVRQWRVCDVGCGTGFLETILADRFGRWYSVDATAAMIAIARQKLGQKPIFWALADAKRLPFPERSFDLVCSNAMLHHVHDYHEVVAGMVSLLKPGGRLFLGYEPNAIPYRLFWPLLMLAAKLVPEHKKRDQIRDASGQGSHATLKEANIHEVAEYHIFQGRGIHPKALQEMVRGLGIGDTKLHFTTLYQLALLKDSGVPVPIDMIPKWCFELPGRLSLSFSLTGTKVL